MTPPGARDQEPKPDHYRIEIRVYRHSSGRMTPLRMRLAFSQIVVRDYTDREEVFRIVRALIGHTEAEKEWKVQN